MTDVFAICEGIAEDRMRVTRTDDYATGYRQAARDILDEIRAKRSGRNRTELERDLRDAEVEARTLARVVAAAQNVVESIHPHTTPIEAVQNLLLVFFAADDFCLEQQKRAPDPPSSVVRLKLPPPRSRVRS